MYRHHRRHFRHRRRGRHAHRFGPWAWEGRFFHRGELPLAILSLLSEGPRHGYELMTELETRSGGCYRPSAGSIYPTLQQLQDQGYVSSQEAEGGRRIYELTDAGRERLNEEEETVEDMWGRVSNDDWGDWGYAYEPDAAELIRPTFRLMREAVRSVGRDPAKREQVREILRRARDEIRALRNEPSQD